MQQRMPIDTPPFDEILQSKAKPLNFDDSNKIKAMHTCKHCDQLKCFKYYHDCSIPEQKIIQTFGTLSYVRCTQGVDKAYTPYARDLHISISVAWRSGLETGSLSIKSSWEITKTISLSGPLMFSLELPTSLIGGD